MVRRLPRGGTPPEERRDLLPGDRGAGQMPHPVASFCKAR